MEPMDHVAAHQQGDTEAGFLHGDALELIEPGRIHLVEDGADLAAADGFRVIGGVAACGYLVHLAYLLGQGHFREELLHAAFHFRGRTDRRGRTRPGTGSRSRREDQQDKVSYRLHYCFW